MRTDWRSVARRGYPVTHIIVSVPAGKPEEIAAVCTHDIEAILAGSVGVENLPGSVRRPARKPVDGHVLGQLMHVAPVGVHDVDLPVTVDVQPIGDPGRIRGPGTAGGHTHLVSHLDRVEGGKIHFE